MSLEWRVKMILSESDANWASCLCSITADDGARSLRNRGIGLVENKVFMASGSYDMDTTDGFHVYRMTMDGTGCRLYVDGVASPVLTGTLGAGAAISIEFGDETGGADAEYQTDYIRWTDGGAFAFPSTGTVIMIR